MEFDVVLTNPPFQDSKRRGKTPHKLWIEFTELSINRLLKAGGSLIQVSPASFGSPSSKILPLLGRFRTHVLRFGTEHHFPTVGSSFSDYWVETAPTGGENTLIVREGKSFHCVLDETVPYLPTDITHEALSIHGKVMFPNTKRLALQWDYVTCHNILRHRNPDRLSETPSPDHPYPVFHTNRSTWYSSVRQSWAEEKKVMWTRSGYTKPFFDDGRLGGTDMVYFVVVASDAQGKALAHNLNQDLFRYIFKTAKWSGFGNEQVFRMLPDISDLPEMSNTDLFTHFGISDLEAAYVQSALG